jgi:hypothetical protein
VGEKGGLYFVLRAFAAAESVAQLLVAPPHHLSPAWLPHACSVLVEGAVGAGVAVTCEGAA